MPKVEIMQVGMSIISIYSKEWHAKSRNNADRHVHNEHIWQGVTCQKWK